MTHDPRRPTLLGSPALTAFREHFELPLAGEPEVLLEAVARSFSRIPYENLTKIVKRDQEPTPERARRTPLEVLRDHASTGAGGTCFSLTRAMLEVLRALNFEAQPLLADRHYGQNTHCALVVWSRGTPCLLDPGYLIVRPVPLSTDREKRILTPFNEILLTPTEGGSKLHLSAVDGSRCTRRLTIKTSPADESEFLRAWDASFKWDMMRYPLLTRVVEGRQLYLQGNRFQVRTRAEVNRRHVDAADIPGLIQREFGVREAVAANAIEVLKRQGEIHAGAFTS